MPLAANPARLYRALATAEMVTWALLLAGMFAKYVLKAGDAGVRVGGGIHGFVFLSYLVVTVLVATDQRWSSKDAGVGMASAIIPFATLPFERSAERRGLLGHEWRLRTDAPVSLRERLAAWAVRRPVLAAVVAVLVVALVFAGLLAAGPPGDWFN